MPDQNQKKQELSRKDEIPVVSEKELKEVDKEFKTVSIEELLKRRKENAETAVTSFEQTTENKVAMVKNVPGARDEDKNAAERTGIKVTTDAKSELTRLQQEISELETKFKNPDTLNKEAVEKQILEKKGEMCVMEEATVRESDAGGFVDLATNGSVRSHKEILKEIKAEQKAKAEIPKRTFQEHEPVIVMNENGVLESGWWKVLEVHDKEITVGKHSASEGTGMKLVIRKIPLKDLIEWNPVKIVSSEKIDEKVKKDVEIDLAEQIKKNRKSFEKLDSTETPVTDVGEVSKTDVDIDKRIEEIKKRITDLYGASTSESEKEIKSEEKFGYIISKSVFEGTPAGLQRAFEKIASQIEELEKKPDKTKKGEIIFDDFSAFNLGFVNPKNLHELQYAVLKLEEYIQNRREIFEKEINDLGILPDSKNKIDAEKTKKVIDFIKNRKEEIAQLSGFIKKPLFVQANKKWSTASEKEKALVLEVDKLVNERTILLRKGDVLTDVEKNRISEINSALDKIGTHSEQAPTFISTDTEGVRHVIKLYDHPAFEGLNKDLLRQHTEKYILDLIDHNAAIEEKKRTNSTPGIVWQTMSLTDYSILEKYLNAIGHDESLQDEVTRVKKVMTDMRVNKPILEEKPKIDAEKKVEEREKQIADFLGESKPKPEKEVKAEKKPKEEPEKKPAVKPETKTPEKPKVMTEAERKARLEDLMCAAEVLGYINSRDQLSPFGDLEGREREMAVLGIAENYSDEVIQKAAEVYRARLNYAGKYETLMGELKRDKKIKKLADVKEERMRIASLVITDGLKKLGIALQKNEREKLVAAEAERLKNDPAGKPIDIESILKDPTRKGASWQSIMLRLRDDNWRKRTESEIQAEYGKKPGLIRRGFYKVANMSPKSKVMLAMGIGAVGGAVPGLVGGLVGALCGIGTQKLMNKWMKNASEKDRTDFSEKLELEFRSLVADEPGYYDAITEKKYEEVSAKQARIADKLKAFYAEKEKQLAKRANIRRVVSTSASLLVGAAAGGTAGWGAAQLGAPGWADIHTMLSGHSSPANMAVGTEKVTMAVGSENLDYSGGNFEPITAKPGDSVWSLLKKDFLANDPGFKDYPVKLQNYIIDTYKDGVVANPKAFGLIDANIIQPGFGKELGVFVNHPDAFQIYSSVVLKGAKVLGMH